MKNSTFIFVLLITICCWSQQNETTQKINVLFIGNNLTSLYEMPQTVQKMLNETDPNIKIEQSAVPGQSLLGHMTNIITSRTEKGVSTRKKEDGEKTETEIKIAEKIWDYVILQTGNTSVLIPENREFQTNKAISVIKDLICNPKCKFILFNTWPAKNQYPKQYCYPSSLIDDSIKKDNCCSTVLENLEHEVKILNESYDLVAKQNELLKSDNGNKFYEVLTKYPEIEIYENDSLPNKYGSFLNACVFYQMLTNKKAINLKYFGEIEKSKAKTLKKVAD